MVGCGFFGFWYGGGWYKGSFWGRRLVIRYCSDLGKRDEGLEEDSDIKIGRGS